MDSIEDNPYKVQSFVQKMINFGKQNYDSLNSTEQELIVGVIKTIREMKLYTAKQFVWFKDLRKQYHKKL